MRRLLLVPLAALVIAPSAAGEWWIIGSPISVRASEAAALLGGTRTRCKAVPSKPVSSKFECSQPAIHSTTTVDGYRHTFDQTACRWLVQSVRAKKRGYFRLKTLAEECADE